MIELSSSTAGLCRCSWCRKLKPFEAFARNAGRRGGGRQSYCRECAVARHRIFDPRPPGAKRIREARERFRVAQGGGCAICRCALVEGGGELDHVPRQSRSEAVNLRGTLCKPCNVAVAHHENGKRLNGRVAAYLAAYYQRVCKAMIDAESYRDPIGAMLPRGA